MGVRWLKGRHLASGKGLYPRLVHARRGQMAVELMVVMPVVVALAIVALDCMVYFGDCARFDRVAGEAVRLHGASPSSAEYGASESLGEIQQEISRGMGNPSRLSFAVSCDGALVSGISEPGSIGSYLPQPRTYTCTLSFTPWPLASGAFGVQSIHMSHGKSYVVDPYRPGVIA